MYGIRLVIRNLIRCRRRNIVSGILLMTAISVIFCAAFFEETGRNDINNLNRKYSKRYYIGFRKELTDYPVSIVGDDGNYYYDEELALAREEEFKKYDHPYPMSLEMYETLALSEYCISSKIAYADTAFGFTEGELPEWMQDDLYNMYAFAGFEDDEIEIPERIVTEHTVVGGDLEAFSRIVKEFSGELFGFVITEGKDPGNGECVITDYFASLYGKGIGDTIVLYDINGNPITSMTVSGISKLYSTLKYDETYPDYPKVSEYQNGSFFSAGFDSLPMTGTPHDRLGTYDGYLKEMFTEYYTINAAMMTVILTDFDTAFNLYGTVETDTEFAERHNFNNFFAYFDLKDDLYADAFEKKVHEVMPREYSDEFAMYSFDSTLDDCLINAESAIYDANLLYKLSVPLAFFVFLTVSLFLIREKNHDIGIYLSLGMNELSICIETAAENTAVMFFSSAAAYWGGYVIYRVISADYDYFKLLEKDYGLTNISVLSSVLMMIGGFVFTVLFTIIYIRMKSPIRLIRQE